MTDRTARSLAALHAARAYLGAGLSLIPVARDGTKAPSGLDLPVKADTTGQPVLNGHGRPQRTWDPYKERLPTEEEIRAWFDREQPAGIGVVGGKVSGNLECLDFDKGAEAIYPQWRELVEAECPGLVGRLTVVKTPRRPAGYHVRYRCPGVVIPGNTKLAVDPSLPRGEQTLIETRGDGGYALAPGSPGECHETGGTYEHVSGPKLSQVQAITAEEREILIRCAASFTREANEPAGTPRGTHLDLSPGDDFNAHGPDWPALLEPHGWVLACEVGGVKRWRRPGKDRGWSATTGHCTSEAGRELFACFSENAQPFDGASGGKPCSTYSKFAVYTLLNHNGDFAAAARALAKQGYGCRAQRNGSPEGKPSDPKKPQGKPPAAASVTRKRVRSLLPYRPFPVEALPAPVGEYVRQAAVALGCDPAFVVLPALAVVASAIGNTRTIRLKRDWHEPSVVWSLIVGDSGTLKSPAYQKAVGHLFRLQKRLLAEYRAAMAKYEEALAAYQAAAKKRRDEGADPGEPPEQPVYRRVVLSDITIQKVAEVLEDNPRGVLVGRDELAGWLGSFRQYKGKSEGSDLPNWLEMYRAGTVIVDRKTGDRRHYFVERAAVSITGGIQPGVLVRAFTPEFLESGGGARIVMAMPPKRPKRWSEVEVTPEVEEAYHTALDKLLALNFGHNGKGEPVPHELNLSKEARAAWIAFVNSWGEEQAAVEGELAAAFSKLEAYAARFALLHHVVGRVARGEDDLAPVGRESIEAGVTLCRWCAYEARRIYSTLTETVPQRDTRRLVEFIQSRGNRITARQLQRSNNRKYPISDDADAALASLVQAGLAEWQPSPSSEEGGRPTRTLILCTTPDITDKTPDGEGCGDDDPPEDVHDTSADTTSTNSQISRDSRGSVSFVRRRAGSTGAPEGANDGGLDQGGSVVQPEEGFVTPFDDDLAVERKAGEEG
jgi:hypothetical protein